MTLSETRSLLDSAGIRLTRSLGQNFLHDANQLRKIVAAARLQPSDPVLEIGPGLGPLTELLARDNRTVLAIEKDLRLLPLLHQRFPSHPNLTLRGADALDEISRPDTDWSAWKVVSNLPYSVGSAILVDLAWHPHPPRSITATLQLEVVQRLTAKPGSKTYGLLTLLVGLAFSSAASFQVPRTCFFPVPDVDSACIQLERRPVQPLDPLQARAFGQIVRQGFSQRRKMMFKLLRPHWPQEPLATAYSQARIPIDARAETVDGPQFIELAKALAHTQTSNPPDYARGNL